MRKLLSTILVLFVASGIFASATLQANEINVTIDGVAVDFDGQPPTIVDGRTLVPVRGVFEHIGFEVDWDQDAQMATLTRYDFTIRIIIGEQAFGIDDYVREATGNIELDVPAQIIGGRTLLPIRAVLESVGYAVDWDGDTRTVVVASGQPLYASGDYVTIGGERFSTALTVLELIDEGLNNDDILVLQYMENLTELWLTGNYISDLSPLAGLTNLTELTIGWNYISDITPLAGLTNLTWLNLGGNEISDITPLAGLGNLTHLFLHSNNIDDVAPLAGLANLDELWLTDNQIHDISLLAGLTGLVILDIARNPISDISILPSLTNLEGLWLAETEIIDISPLAGLANLEYLSLWGNQIADISPLIGLNLVWLDLYGNPVEDWSYVDHMEEVGGRPE